MAYMYGMHHTIITGFHRVHESTSTTNTRKYMSCSPLDANLSRFDFHKVHKVLPANAIFNKSSLEFYVSRLRDLL